MKRLRNFAAAVAGARAIAGAVALMALCATLALPAHAQVTTGSISGTVVDQSGAAVPGATITATNRETHASAVAQSNDSGYFKLGFLAVGSYDVTIDRPSFRSVKISAAAVQVNADNNLGGIKLELGSASATVEVTAAPPLVEADTAQITNTFTDQTVSGFVGVGELEGLDFLALQVPGVNSTRDLNFLTNNNGPGFSVNGLRGENNDQQVDGQNNNDNSIGGPALFISNSDWVSEYQIVTNNFGAEYGRNAGSVVNEITKSGTNTWHGTVSDVENNSVLNTLTNQEKFFNGLTKVPHSNFSSPSTTIGGPLWTDHVFVYGGFDTRIIRPAHSRQLPSEFRNWRAASLAARRSPHYNSLDRSQSVEEARRSSRARRLLWTTLAPWFRTMAAQDAIPSSAASRGISIPAFTNTTGSTRWI
jgi:hypothetical protein